MVKTNSYVHNLSCCENPRTETLDSIDTGAVPIELYSCFEKGCATKPYATMPKGIMGNGVYGL